MEPIVELKGITKRFPSVVANDRVDLSVLPGEIHAVVGENGAGKSTLMRVLYGLYQPDAGEIFVRGRRRVIDNPRRAVSLGIGMVHQHFMLIPRFTVLENVILGYEPSTAGLLRLRRAEERVGELCRLYGFALKLRAPVSTLSVGEQQRVEIIKVLYRGADILILDEPTALLVPQEVEELFANLRRLKQQGKTIIFISHKLDEVLKIADRVTVLRRGRVMGTVPAAGTTKGHLAELMVGRPVLFRVEKAPVTPGEELLRVEGLKVAGPHGRPVVNGVSFAVRAGEIYGLAGVEGNGQLELLEALMGLRPVAAGRVAVAGRDATGLSTREIRLMGVAYIPEDRQKRGLVLPMTIWENIVLGAHRERRFLRGPLLKFTAMLPYAQGLAKQYDVRIASLFMPALALSGGNQQKVIVAREFGRAPRVLVAAHPTRGLDVGAMEFVWQRLLEARAGGQAIFLISADLEEILSLSDRIGVIYNGRLVAEFASREATPELLGHYMLGAETAAPEEPGPRGGTVA
ncbi:MAG: ABC transporter ATP-binding protein [Anaerolineae bacterium]|nr:ABC transporter ATP-binding protein [Anaerolineae bacterium]